MAVGWLRKMNWTSDRPKFDQAKAAEYLGKHLLIGITYLDQSGKPVEQQQYHGAVIRINKKEGIVIKLHGSGEEFRLPPDLAALKEAPRGEYKLHSSGEVVVNPDLLTTWTIKKPKEFLSRNIGDRILLGALCLTTALVFGALVWYFISSGRKDLYYFVLFDFSFSLTLLSLLGVIWAAAAPEFLKRIIMSKAKQVLLLAAILLTGVIIFTVYLFIS